MTEALPFCTECAVPRIAVWECADGTTRCTMCIEQAIREGTCEAWMATETRTGKAVTCELVYGHEGPHEATSKRRSAA